MSRCRSRRGFVIAVEQAVAQPKRQLQAHDVVVLHAMAGVDHIADMTEPISRRSDSPVVDSTDVAQRLQHADVVAVRVADDHADVARSGR